MDSQNGTLVNCVPIREETPLKPGDLLKVGPLVLEFVLPKSPAAARSPSHAETAAATEESILDWLSADAGPEEADGSGASKPGASGKEAAIRRRSYRYILIKDVADDAAVVHLANTKRVSDRNYTQAINELVALVEEDGYQQIVLSLTDVEYIHPTALDSLSQFERRLRSLGGALRLCNLHPVLRELFEAAGRESPFDIHDDEPSALRGFA